MYPYLGEFNTGKNRPVVINYSTMFVSITAVYVPGKYIDIKRNSLRYFYILLKNFKLFPGWFCPPVGLMKYRILLFLNPGV